MNPENFSQGAPGRVIHTPFDYWAFAPNPLPPELKVKAGIVREITGRARNRVYRADEIVAAIDEPM